MSKRVAVVTGANKGIGFSLVKGLCKKFDGIVYLTSRDKDRGQAAVNELKKLGLHPEYHQLDVSDKSSVKIFTDHLKQKYDGLDILINNAGVAPTSEEYEDCKYVININYRSALVLEEKLFPLVRENGRILHVSSDCGHLSNIRNKHWIELLSNKNITVDSINEFVEWFLDSIKCGTFNKDDIADGGSVASYRVAKVALSAVTMVQQKKWEHKNISINSVHPGLVRTDMTHEVGFLSTKEAADNLIYLVMEAPQTLKGAYIWHDRSVLDWYDYNADYYFKYSTLGSVDS